ncbi:uncharacterized protein [Arachis hypogaea]|uniref:uncharacterized protein n=1 Tax=Arachis hypogaea TaxID=3818 RepID=UPI000DEC47C1|nr:uncharacterized protein LOC112726473 [Arachis hypogaea]XP_025631662.1 uncharacterized protein LOC112726478 [Arachis hypogaea]QHO22461.1 uncharacterized protein DS421_12g355480 [Arachis hypogaea]
MRGRRREGGREGSSPRRHRPQPPHCELCFVAHTHTASLYHERKKLRQRGRGSLRREIAQRGKGCVVIAAQPSRRLGVRRQVRVEGRKKPLCQCRAERDSPPAPSSSLLRHRRVRNRGGSTAPPWVPFCRTRRRRKAENGRRWERRRCKLEELRPVAADAPLPRVPFPARSAAVKPRSASGCRKTVVDVGAGITPPLLLAVSSCSAISAAGERSLVAGKPLPPRLSESFIAAAA